MYATLQQVSGHSTRTSSSICTPMRRLELGLGVMQLSLLPLMDHGEWGRSDTARLHHQIRRLLVLSSVSSRPSAKIRRPTSSLLLTSDNMIRNLVPLERASSAKRKKSWRSFNA